MNRPGIGNRYRIEALKKAHSRKDFICGTDTLDAYFHKQASQDARRKVAAVFVAVEKNSKAIHGYYTLSMAEVLLDRLPDSLVKKMPRYPALPAIRLGRLAVHQSVQGKRLGTFLLMDAMHRSVLNEVAWVAFMVDAKNDQVREFYLQLGFHSFDNNPNQLYKMRQDIDPLFR